MSVVRDCRPREAIYPIGFALLLIAVLLVCGARSASASSRATNGDEQCLTCHNDPKLQMTFPSGQIIGLKVSLGTLNKSVHGGKLRCVDCHSDKTQVPHLPVTANDRREYSIQRYASCQKCHQANYEKTLDSVHAKQLKAGNVQAPLCTDCHGTHDVQKTNTPTERVTIAQKTCAQCHTTASVAFSGSAHGKPLIESGSLDVPTCIDCHGVHKIEDPRDPFARVRWPDTCGRCHGDKALMQKYNLTSNVYSAYRADFHGVTTTFYKTKYPNAFCTKATCIDCHGTHSILAPSNAASTLSPQNKVRTCSRCHPGATASFAKAWSGHEPPGPKNAPATFYVKLFYWIFIPVVIGGMVLHIGFDFGHEMLTGRRHRRDEEV